jgi:branched-chain amino acid transport system substrate-binding protein
VANNRINCRRPAIGYMGPLTGDAASIGQETIGWARYAVNGFNASRTSRQSNMKFRLIPLDTRLDAALASTAAQRLASNTAVAGVVGPAGSQEVVSSGPIFRRSSLAFVSGSATRTSLTNGSIPTFFRVVPNDAVQGPTVARYIARTLRRTRVAVLDDQTSYGQPLANSIAANLRAARATITLRESVNQDQTDFSSLVSRIPRDTQIVVLAWQLANRAQVFTQQMRAQGRTAVIFGTDGLYQPGQFTVNNSYISSFAPDIRTLRAAQPFVRGYLRQRGVVRNFGTFGPPVHEATRALINAIRNACASIPVRRTGLTGPRRSEIVLQMRRTLIRPSLFGTTLSFTRRGDVRGAKFFIFQIRNGRYVTIG